jgi:hypothetical protein
MEFLGQDRVKFNQPINLGRVTTSERDSLTGLINGDKIHNTDLDREQYYKDGIWLTISTDDDSFINALIFG